MGTGLRVRHAKIEPQNQGVPALPMTHMTDFLIEGLENIPGRILSKVCHVRHFTYRLVASNHRWVIRAIRLPSQTHRRDKRRILTATQTAHHVTGIVRELLGALSYRIFVRDQNPTIGTAQR